MTDGKQGLDNDLIETPPDGFAPVGVDQVEAADAADLGDPTPSAGKRKGKRGAKVSEPAPPSIDEPADELVEVPPPSKQPRRAEVLRDVTVSRGGQMVKLRAGDIVCESSYGPGCIEWLDSACVAYREV